MNFEIEKDDWSGFFDSLSKRRFEWKTRVEVLKDEMGDQVLADGLPLNGITVERKDDGFSIDISIGESGDSHQTHNILDPTRVAFLSAETGHGEVVDIEEKDGTKTLISLIAPAEILFTYTEINEVSTAAA